MNFETSHYYGCASRISLSRISRLAHPPSSGQAFPIWANVIFVNLLNFSDLFPNLAKAVVEDPCCFIKAWLDDSGLPNGLLPHDHVMHLDSVVRQFLWNDFPPGHAKNAIVVVTEWDNSLHQMDHCISHLQQLSNISPILQWKIMELFLKRDAKITVDLLRMFIHAQVGLQLSATKQQLSYRLRELQKRASSITSIGEERLEDITYERFRSIQEKRWKPLDQDYIDLLKLGTTQSGRQYLSVQMGLHWLDLTRA